MIGALEKFLLSAGAKAKKLDEMDLSTILAALGTKAASGTMAAGKAVARDPKLAAGAGLAGAGAGYLAAQPNEEEAPLEDEELMRKYGMMNRGI